VRGALAATLASIPAPSYPPHRFTDRGNILQVRDRVRIILSHSQV